MRIQMSSGNCDIVANSESFLFDDSEELILHIDDNGERSYITFQFVQDNSKKQRIVPRGGADRLTLTCYNFNSRLGAGLKKPVLVGESNGQNMYIMFWTKVYGSHEPFVRSVQFTIFRER